MSAPQTNLCRLCVNICQDYKPLQDENGAKTKFYEITAQYFDSMFLNVQQGNHITIICSICWHHIFDFHNFQQSVVKAQQQLINDDFQQFEVVIKSEVEILPEISHNESNEEISDNNFLKVKTEPELPITPTTVNKESASCIDNKTPNEFSSAPEGNCNAAADDITDISSSDLDRNYSSDDDDDSYLLQLRDNINSSSDSLCNQTNNERHNSKNVPKDKPTETQKLKELDEFISQHYPNLECVICCASCSSYSTLELHFRRQHPKDKCHIFCCERRLGSRFQIEEHVHLHNDPNAFQCTICYKPFNGRYSLYSHVYAQHRKTTTTPRVGQVVESKEEKTRSRKKKSMELDAVIAQWKPALKCLVCTNPFPNFSLLRQHYRQRHPNEECCLFCCGRKFNDRSKLGEHVHYHVDPNVYKCELCDARHNCKRNLYFHIRTYHPHSRDGLAPDTVQIKKPPRKKRCITITSREIDNSIAQYRPSLDCDLCSESCENFTLLKSHYRLHHPSVPFYIQCCQRKFNNRSEFENHLRLHIDPNAFKCELCGKSLSSVKKLRAHKNRIHFKYRNDNAQENVDIDVD